MHLIGEAVLTVDNRSDRTKGATAVRAHMRYTVCLFELGLNSVYLLGSLLAQKKPNQ